MSRKGENIYKRKDGRWEGRYKKGRKSNGQLKYGYVYGKSYKEVKSKLYSYCSYYEDIIHSKGDCAMVYEEWSMKWLRKKRLQLKLSTYSSYSYKLTRYVFPLLGDIPLNQLTSENIQKSINQWLEEGLQPSTIRVLYYILKKSLIDACEQGLLLQIPCRGIILPRIPKKSPQSLSRKEQEQLEIVAKASPLYQGLPVLLALDAGLRIGEVSALRWKDIDLDKKMIYVRQTVQRIQRKNGGAKTVIIVDSPKTDQAIRAIPMSFTLYKYLKRWKKKSTSSYVCSNHMGPSEPRLITYYFSCLKKKAQITQTHFHSLRHTFATRCIESSPDVASVSRLLGHSSSKTTLDVYTDSFLEGRQRVIIQMEKNKKAN
ncbi:tyrosine-type recombinase/integrase [Vagococcus martis]